jgi:site-specific DNA-cytosine methylase
LNHVLLRAKDKHPLIFILENLCALKHCGLDEIVELLSSEGYSSERVLRAGWRVHGKHSTHAT